MNLLEAIESDDTDEVREQDRFLPIANISRIMKKALPTNAKVSPGAMLSDTPSTA